jgi:hypothetical protein
VSAPEPEKRIYEAGARLQKKVSQISDAWTRLDQELQHRRQAVHAVTIVELGRDALVDIAEIIAAASVVLYRGQTKP